MVRIIESFEAKLIKDEDDVLFEVQREGTDDYKVSCCELQEKINMKLTEVIEALPAASKVPKRTADESGSDSSSDIQ